MTSVTGGRTLKLSSYSLALITPLRIENKNDRSRNPIGAAARRVLRVAQIVAVDHLGLRIGQQRVSEITLDGEGLEYFGRVIGQSGNVVAALFNLGGAAPLSPINLPTEGIGRCQKSSMVPAIWLVGGTAACAMISPHALGAYSPGILTFGFAAAP